MKLQSKLNSLGEIIDGYGQMLVALSGGVDSIFLTAFAFMRWRDDRIAALTAYGPHFAADEMEYAQSFCHQLGISHKKISVDGVLPLIKNNPEDRCYICKKEIFSALKQRAQMTGSVLADGTNADDKADYRPGSKALRELEVASPLKEAELTKEEIRRALKKLGEEDNALMEAFKLPGSQSKMIWEKPAFACLASRIPYGEEINVPKLEAVYKAEVYLKELGFDQVRVRHHGDVARIEVTWQDMNKFFDRELMSKVNDRIRECGFRYVALDLGGYQMGSLNPKAK